MFFIEAGSGLACLMSRDDNGASLYFPGYNTFDFTDDDNLDEVAICITQPGHISYLGVYAPTVHLQSDTIAWDYHVFAKETIAGRNVTNKRDEGDFVIENGKTTIESPQGVTIQGGFEVKLGAELEINVGN